MGTQKNHLNEHPKHMLKLMGKKIFTFLCSKFCLSKPVFAVLKKNETGGDLWQSDLLILCGHLLGKG